MALGNWRVKKGTKYSTAMAKEIDAQYIEKQYRLPNISDSPILRQTESNEHEL